MQYKAIIEIPKGCDRRIHMKYDGSGFEDFGPIVEKIPINNGIMPVAYGYILDAINEQEKDNVDVLIFSNKEYETGDEVLIDIIGLMNRDDGDHKVIAKDSSESSSSFANLNGFDDLPADERKLILEYFGYNKKITLTGREEALVYIDSCTANLINDN